MYIPSQTEIQQITLNRNKLADLPDDFDNPVLLPAKRKQGINK